MSQRDLPSLDLLTGFEAAARHLSFTKAASELFRTQSAISRQIQALEEELGVALFERRHRALLLTEQGQIFFRSVSEMLVQLREATRQVRGTTSTRLLTVTTTVSFAALWLVPRLPRFRTRHPHADVRISADNSLRDLARDRIDVAIRYAAVDMVPAQAVRLFGDEVLPVCSPALLRDRRRPLKTPQDLRHHVLLHDDEAAGRWPWLDWGTWFQAQGIADLEPAGELRFSHYDQIIQAAADGQGVALGRIPLINSLLGSGRLVAPFEHGHRRWRRPTSSRSFFAVAAPAARGRQDVQDFIAWLQEETRGEAAADAG